MKVEVKNLEGKKVGDVELDASVFGAKVNEHLLWEMVKQQRATQRAGTHSTKRRDEVRGGGKKPWKQKGTGRARQGSSRAPQWVGGGSVFGPKPRDYSYKMTKKSAAGALRSALSLRTGEKKLVVLDAFKLDKIKTARVAEALEKLGASSALIVDAENNNLQLSTRNLASAKYLRTEGVNVYDILNHESLVVTKAVVAALNERLKVEKTEGAK